jgi:signal peptidase I
MADEHNPPSPAPNPQNVQPAPSPAGPASQNVTAAPAAAATPPEGSAFSIAEFSKGLLRSTLHLLIGAAVGGVAGLVINYLLIVLNVWNGDVKLATGGGILAGIFFNGYIVRALRLAPKKERAAQAAPADGPPPDSFREVVETVVFVVVLVLLLKSFVAEAFVIPTGSMAETLLGYQKWAVCPECGYRFPVNCSQQVDPQQPGAADFVDGGICPNCRAHVRFITTGKPAGPDEIPDPGWGSGDRVLVSKFIYDLFGTPADRLDVVVFKYPGMGVPGRPESFPATGPFRDGVPMNYIKRLVGLAGETIAIHHGDLYALEAPNDKMIADAERQLRDELKRDPTPDELHDRLLQRFDRIAYFDLERAKPEEREELARQLWQRKYMHIEDSALSDTGREALNLFEASKTRAGLFSIIRKSPDNILAMERMVYDNDHQARDLAGVQPPRWADRGPGGWAADGKTGFRLAAPSDDAVHWLGYRHLLRNPKLELEVSMRRLDEMLKSDKRLREEVRQQLRAARGGLEPEEADLTAERLPRDLLDRYLPSPADVPAQLRDAYAHEAPQLVTDFMGYNTWEGRNSGGPHVPYENWVADLILECDAQADQAKGELTLELSKGVDRFRARFDLASGDCKLLRVHNAGKKDEQEEELARKPTALRGGSHHVRFANVDQRLTVWVDDGLPFGDGVIYRPPEDEGPSIDNDLEPAGVGARGAGIAVRGLKLWRDTYYTTQQGDLANNHDMPSNPDAGLGVHFAKPDTWGPLHHLPTKTIYVQPKHYLCMGDNSPESSDGRTWGLVPERLLLGKALAVYYPFDRFGRIR